ncbi:flagellar basal body P-ring biosynthesis protein FlgA [bacterium BMS3Abin03]|nr:flagellar basal body P-ring biosynthesis protein FlgA [bacterium BMS3Abin03]HDZ58904.1 flagellar basal body P-ring formation protein FlgA [Ignavibacteriales bacterium]
MIAVLISILLLVSQPGSDLKNDISKYLNNHFKEYEKFEYEIIRIPSGYSAIEILNDKEFKINGTMAYIPVKIRRNKHIAQSYISIRLKLYKVVLVTVRDVKRKGELRKADLELSLQNIAGINGRPITTIDKIGLYRSKKNLKQGEIITENDIEKLPVIKVGDRVKGSIVRGNVIIQTDVVSKQEGSVGDIISVHTMENKIFKAKVVDNNNVIIVE